MELLLLCLSLWILQHNSAEADSIIHIGKHPIQTGALNSRNARGDRLLRNVLLLSCSSLSVSGFLTGRCYRSHSLGNTWKSCRLLCLVVRHRRGSRRRLELLEQQRAPHAAAPRLRGASVEPAIFPQASTFTAT